MEKVPVTGKALLQRINRVLAKDNKKMCKSRSYGEKSNLGDWHVIDTYINGVIDHHCTLAGIGEETGALKAYECLIEE
jgi:hypothetical protein